MKNRELIVPLCLKGNLVMRYRNLVFADRKEVGKSMPESSCMESACANSYPDEFIQDAPDLAASCENFGADALLLFDLSEGDAEHNQSIGMIKKISRATDLPIYGGGNIRRLEDVKKLIYAGCTKVFLNYGKEGNVELTNEASARFGKEKILACVKTAEEREAAQSHAELLGGVLLLDETLCEKNILSDTYCVVEASRDSDVVAKSAAFLNGAVTGVFCEKFAEDAFAFMDVKHALKEAGIAVNTYESSLAWEEMRKGSDGLLPVVVQDYRTLEVLMLDYMNEEAYPATVRTGRMTYWSRSREELWVKGLTSGHFQYVRELVIDCDNDTLLAKVVQVGAACHTGNRSCFYRPILTKNYDSSNPMRVFEEVFSVIEDRKQHPKEGSYTNYLFEKGIDKILKKVGEEATEIIIAAKNPDPEEVIYEISDFLYHVMVLMSEKGLTWEDITEELAKR
ncbi:MAG: bifunctional phosphoribosyl-AMP cyclohydrolase/phosphoribosyl-ATP diphosphatase HisIE [Clostridiales bacterium]|nr:bifunctional phosphoribosyl-AMP cyclohydrolase/phosphoribosyl-ATP diphosphatase HisIE [Clostridiales bacterium]